MSNTNDSFIDEVTEEVRRDRLFGYFRRYGWIGVVAILALVGGAAYTEWRRASDAAAAEARGDAFYAAIAAPEAAARAEAIAGLDATGATSAPKLMLEASSLAEAGETERAAEVYATLAADASQPRPWRDLAALKRILLLDRALSPDERLAALAPLAEPGAPFRVLAVEQQAMARLDAGDREAAIAGLKALLEDQETTAGLRSRAAQLMVALGASPDGT